MYRVAFILICVASTFAGDPTTEAERKLHPFYRPNIPPMLEGSAEQWGCDPKLDRLTCSCVAAWQTRHPIDLGSEVALSGECTDANVGDLGSIVCAYAWQRTGSYVVGWALVPEQRPIVVVTDESARIVDGIEIMPAQWTCLDLEYRIEAPPPPPPQATIRQKP